MKYPYLLEPLALQNLTFSNRIVMPPMATYLAREDGLVTKEHIEHYQRSVGPGLIIVEGTAVSPDGRTGKNQLGIYNDRHIAGLAKIAKTIKVSGSVAGIQLHHAGATAFMETLDKRYYHYAVILWRLIHQQFIFSGLDRIREAFRKGARRAVEAGFDIIEVHAAHGYLFNQFLSPRKNWRRDRYGGSLENRRRFLFEVYRAIVEEVSGKAMVTCRLGIADRNKKGFSLPEGLSTASLLAKEGMKLIDVSNGNGIPSNVKPEGSRYSARLHLAREAKSALQIPVIGGGGIVHPDLADEALQDKMADMIYIGRGILADPSWARKTIAGTPEKISLCRKCKVCFHYSAPSKCPGRRKK